MTGSRDSIAVAAPGSTPSFSADQLAGLGLPTDCSKSANDVIAFSNNYTGNGFRQTMIKTWQDAADAAKAQGCLKDYKVLNTAENTAAEQIAQINSLILSGVSAIDIDSASSTALNDVITQACNKGIVVVVFDSLGSTTCEYDMGDDIPVISTTMTKGMADLMGGQGNMMIVRGLVGTETELPKYQTQLDVLKNYPNIKVVSTPTGQSSESVTEAAVAAVIPSLPHIDGVLTAGGGDSMGVVTAFQNAHMTVPPVALDNSGQGIQFWAQNIPNGYKTISVGAQPGVASAAFWETVELLNGATGIPKLMQAPPIVITQDTIAQWAAVTPATNIATYIYSRQQADDLIKANFAGGPLPLPAVPTNAP
jgi:ribose transport system substrate-binding protein